MAKQSPLAYLPEVSGQERPDINVQTEEALNTLLEALERRREKPMFDPVGLATAGGFMKPTRTGSGFEALSNAIEAYTGARQGERQREIEDAQQYLGVVGQLGEIERRKRRDKQFQGLFGGTPQTTLGVAPSARPAEEEIVVTDKRVEQRGVPGSENFTPPGLPQSKGYPLLPANENIQTGREYLRGAYLEGKVDYSEALKNAQEVERKRYEVRENGIVDLRTGLFYPTPKGELVERQIRNPNTGVTDTFKIPAGVAMQLDHLQSIGDDDSYDKLARRFTEERSRAAVSGDAGAKVSGAAPSVSAGRPGVAQAPTGGPKSETQKKEEAVRREKRAEEETKIDVEAEAALGANSKSAREMFSAAQRLQKAAELSPNVFGLLQAPTVGSALLTIIRDGIQAGNTSIRIGGFEKALILSYPGVEKEDIKNLEIAYSALAEIELKYTQLYLKGQGQVTEGERLIVRKLGGTPENSPEFLKGQAKLIQMRAQYDIDVIDTFQRLKDQNPNITWTQFQRSPAYRGLENDYNKKLAKEFDLEPAIPTNKRDSSGTKFPEVEDFQKKLQQRRSQQ
jgi:hypothetical protein